MLELSSDSIRLVVHSSCPWVVSIFYKVDSSPVHRNLALYLDWDIDSSFMSQLEYDFESTQILLESTWDPILKLLLYLFWTPWESWLELKLSRLEIFAIWICIPESSPWDFESAFCHSFFKCKWPSKFGSLRLSHII